MIERRRMRIELTIIAVLLVFASKGASQGEPRSKPSFGVAVSAEHAKFKLGAPVPVRLVMKNTTGHDLRFDVMYVVCPPLINAHVTVRQVQVQLYDSVGKPVPLTIYGAVVQGRSGA